MAAFSINSNVKLATSAPALQILSESVVGLIDCTIIEGHRNAVRQNKLVQHGKSQLKYPDSAHNRAPSCAVDVIAYPIDWVDRERQTLFAGYVLGVAQAQGLQLRWGGDWDRDGDHHDQSFHDLPHLELRSWPSELDDAE